MKPKSRRQSVKLECKLKESFIMAGSITRKHLNKNFELSGVFASAAAFLADINKQSEEEGMLYYDTTLNQLRTYDGSSWSPAGQNGVSAGSLDDAVNIGSIMTIDGALTSGVEIEATDGGIVGSGQLLLLDNDDTGSDVHSLEIDQVSLAAAIQITNTTATTDDIQGTSDSWAVTGEGLATFDKGVEILGDTAAATLKLGAGSDITISYTSGVTPGVVGAGLMFKANTAADQIQFGDSSKAIDVWFEGSADANYMLWDASANLLILNGSDIRLEDSDILGFGDSDDVTITWNQSTTALEIEALVEDTGQIRIGSGNAIDLAIYGSTASKIALFDVDTAILEMNGWSINLQTDDFLYLGDSNNVTIRWTSGQLEMLAAANDTLWVIGNGTNSFDIQIFGSSNSDDIVFDASGNQLSFDGIDVKLEDDDYLLLGNSATAGASTDGTIRWDSSNSVVEIIGNTTFEGATIIVDNDLTVSGTLTLSGPLSPSSLAFGDGESLTFGDGNDLTMSATGTTMTVDIVSGSLLEITGTGGNEMTIGAAGNVVNLTVYGTLDIGTDDLGYDVSFFAENGSDLVLWDQNAITNVGAFVFTGSCAYFTDSSGVGDTAILLGSGATNNGDFSIRGTSGTVLLINQVASGVGTMEIGVSGKGITTTFHSEQSGAFMKWDQATNQLQLEGDVGTASLALSDGDKILLGDPLGTGDFVLSSSGNVLTLDQVTTADQSTMIVGASGDGMDMTIWGDTAGSKIKWTTATDSLVFTDAPIVFDGDAVDYTFTTSTDTLLVTATDAAAAKITWGDNGANGLDQEWLSDTAGNLLEWDAADEILKFTDIQCSMIGTNNRGTILTILGADVGTDSDTVLIDHSGAGNAINIDLNEADSSGINIEPFTNSTVAALEVDGNNAGWLGVTGIGMVHLKDDIALGHADATMLMIDKSAAIAEVDSARGSCLTILEDMNVAASGTAYAVHINSTNNSALNVAGGASVFADKVTATAGLQSGSVTVAADIEANQSTIPAGTRYVNATSNDVTKVIILPAAVVGNIITISIAATGCELQTFSGGSDTINTIDCSGGNELALTAGKVYELRCVVVNKWIANGWDADGAAQSTLVPDTD